MDIQERISRSARRSGRNPSDITLVAAVKGRTIEELRTLREKGISHFGENKAQELNKHQKEFSSPAVDVTWHFIGHLQSNKITSVIPHISLLHSLDSWELAQKINAACMRIGKTLDVLVEVNSAREIQKWGVMPEELPEFLRSLRKLKSLRVRGLMTMGKATENPEDSRHYFRFMKQLCDEAHLDVLSMGMSTDFEIAIEEGATIVRIGKALF